MKCPNCKYVNGWDWNEKDEYVETKGDEGGFWELPIKLERRVVRDYYDNGERKAEVYGCPKCKFVFHDG